MPSNTKYIVNGAQLTDIGDAIRSKLGEQDTYTVDEMPEKIGEIGSSTKIVYIPEQTVTTQRYGRDTFYAILDDVNIDINNPPSTFTLKVGNDEYEMEKYDSGGSLISYRRPGSYYIYYDTSYAEGSWVISDSQAIDYATFTVYAEGDAGGGSQLHYATITFVCNLQYGYMIPYYFVENNEVVYRYTEVLGGGGTVTANVLFGLNDDDPEEDHFILDLSLLTSQFGDSFPDITVTNTVNCVHTSIILTITDPDSPASATITISPNSGGGK